MDQDKFFQQLGQFRHTAEGKVPTLEQSQNLLIEIIQFLFPIFCNTEKCTIENGYQRVGILTRETLMRIGYSEADAKTTTDSFLQQLPDTYNTLLTDAEAIFNGDPAAESIEEVIISYPGFYAICVYRIAHIFYLLKVPILPRLFTEYGHKQTGIDIHPGATISEAFCIDHGTGVVIGETAHIGKNVKLYQGVTLGALSVSKEKAGSKRHPTIDHNVTIYAGSTILGGNTVIGHHSVIGGNVWLTHSVDPYSAVLNNSEIYVKDKNPEYNKVIDFVI